MPNDRRSKFHLLSVLIAAIAANLSISDLSFAQDKLEAPALDFGSGRPSSGLFSSNKDERPTVAVKLGPADAKPGDTVTLTIDVEIPAGSYTYSTDKSFIGGTKLRIAELKGLEPIGDDFVADHPPKKVFEPVFKQNIEKFFDRVQWSRKFRLLPDTKPADASMALLLDYQVCNEQRCLPLKEAYDISLAFGAKAFDPQSEIFKAKPTEKTSEKPKIKKHPWTHVERPLIQGKPGPAEISARLEPENAKPGDTVTLHIGIQLDPEWHTYSITQEPGQAAVPTSIKVTGANGLTAVEEAFKPSVPAKKKVTEVPPMTFHQEIHEEAITWTRQFQVDSPDYGIAGSIKYQTCTGDKCLLAKTVSFALGNVPEASTPTEQPETGATAAGGPANDEPLTLREAEATGGSLAFYLVSAFFGGMLLNVMPCVLPVLAIKILSFVKQAGESRGRIFALNLAYAAGVIGVFLALATLAVTLQKGWGELFQNSEFNLIMACLVFAMGLSLLGVFEIPVPGMVGSAAGAQSQQGLVGAFLTGILATLLATPCSGPFMGAALAWSVRETAGITFLIWGVMGIGMASPYLVFGLFPQALRWLPKPGAWMERFKEFSGFVLMGSVIFIITFLDQRYTIPLLIMLLGISVGLWMIGNLYDINSHIRHKTLVRFTAVTLTILICGFGFWLSKPAAVAEGKLPWEPFTEARLNELRQQKKTVLIDFTADWCLSCKTNELVALNTPETLEIVNQHDVITLVADYTDPSDEIKRWLSKFDSVSVPLTVIFPGSRPNEPILIRDLFSQQTLLEQLRKAVAYEPVVKSAARTDISSATP